MATNGNWGPCLKKGLRRQLSLVLPILEWSPEFDGESRDRCTPGIFWPTVLDYLASYGLLRDPVSKKQAQSSQGVTQEFILLPLYIDTQTQTQRWQTDRQTDAYMCSRAWGKVELDRKTCLWKHWYCSTAPALPSSTSWTLWGESPLLQPVLCHQSPKQQSQATSDGNLCVRQTESFKSTV